MTRRVHMCALQAIVQAKIRIAATAACCKVVDLASSPCKRVSHISRYFGHLAKGWSQEKEFLARYDEEVRVYERDHPPGVAPLVTNGAAAARGGGGATPKHPRDRPRPAQEKKVLRERELVALRPKSIAVHCTHGFNRSGYVMVQYAKRMNPALSVAECLKQCVPATGARLKPPLLRASMLGCFLLGICCSASQAHLNDLKLSPALVLSA